MLDGVDWYLLTGVSGQPVGPVFPKAKRSEKKINSDVLTISSSEKCTRGSDKSLARPTSPCILFDGENISFDASLVIYI